MARTMNLLVQCPPEAGRCGGTSWFVTDGGTILARHLFEVHKAETVNGKTQAEWFPEPGAVA